MSNGKGGIMTKETQNTGGVEGVESAVVEQILKKVNKPLNSETQVISEGGSSFPSVTTVQQVDVVANAKEISSMLPDIEMNFAKKIFAGSGAGDTAPLIVGSAIEVVKDGRACITSFPALYHVLKGQEQVLMFKNHKGEFFPHSYEKDGEEHKTLREVCEKVLVMALEDAVVEAPPFQDNPEAFLKALYNGEKLSFILDAETGFSLPYYYSGNFAMRDSLKKTVEGLWPNRFDSFYTELGECLCNFEVKRTAETSQNSPVSGFVVEPKNTEHFASLYKDGLKWSLFLQKLARILGVDEAIVPSLANSNCQCAIERTAEIIKAEAAG